MGFTFELSKVDPDPDALGASSLAQQLEARGLRDVVAADCSEPALADALSLNGFVMAMHVAYTRHRPLTLSPDAVWLCIAQGSKRMPRPSDAAPVGCHACTCPRVDDEDDAQG